MLVLAAFVDLALGATASAVQCAASACGAPTCVVNGTTGVDSAGCCTSATPCKTIQFAVNQSSAGSVISVAAGTYPEGPGPLVINKTLTLCGAESGLDARSPRGAESVITDSQGTEILANNVVIDGFTVEMSTVSAFTGYGIDMGAGTSGTQVYNNILQDNIVGIGLANAGASPPQVLICQNQIQNNNQSGGASGTGIYTDQFVSGGKVTNVLVEDNNFKGNSDAGIDMSNTDSASGVFLLEVRDNVFDMDGRGVLLFNTHQSTIHNNTITNSTLAGSAAVRIFNCNTDDMILFNNIDTGPTYGIRFTQDSTVPLPCLSANEVINDNNIVNFPTGGLLVDAGSTSGTVNAECNWWGCVTGPNTGGCETVVGNADFTPWLVAPSPAPVSGPVSCEGGVTTTTSSTSTTTTTLPDHFQCYEVDHAKTNIAVSLTNQFGTGSATLTRILRLCNPADKNGEDPNASGHPGHMVGYTLRPSGRFTRVSGLSVKNQFGTFTVTVTRPIKLFVPSAKSLTTNPAPPLDAAVAAMLDHFECYKTKGVHGGPTVTVQDEFGMGQVNLLTPAQLCVAVDKNHEGIPNPVAKLLCYRTRLVSGTLHGPSTPVFVNNQFGPNTLPVVGHADEFCVPSSPSGAFLD